MRNLSDRLGAAVGSGGAVDDGGSPEEPPGGPGTDCGGGLAGCTELAAAEVCIPSGSGAAEVQIACVVDAIDAGLNAGDSIAWAADVKATGAEEVNPTGTIKKDATGLLLRDPLDTMDNINVENGSAEVVNGKLVIADETDILVTGIAARASIVCQVRKQSDSGFPWVDPHFVGRLTGTLDGYSARQASISDELWRVANGSQDAELADNDHFNGGSLPGNHRDVLKISVADGVQKAGFGTDVSSQSYDLSVADTVHDGQTGTAGFVRSAGLVDSILIAWDLILCTTDVITCSGLPAGYSIRVGSLEAPESAGTATLDLDGTLYPASFALEILDAGGAPVDAWTPPSGIFGGDSFVYDETGSLGGGAVFDFAGQIDLDIFDSAGVLLQTATTGQTQNQPSYKRLSGTVDLPTGVRFLAPTLRRTGTATAIVCARQVTVREGTFAPWVPCEDAAAGDAAAILGRGPVVLNPDFDEGTGNGAYWGVDDADGSSQDYTLNLASPTLGSIDFEFSSAAGYVELAQVASSAGDANKDATAAGSLRYYPVTPEDAITLVGHVVREDNTSPFTSSLTVYVEYWDADKQRVGGKYTTTALNWPPGDDSADTEIDRNFYGDGRRQASFVVGDGRLQDDFSTHLTEDERQSIRYATFFIAAASGTGSTDVGLKYLEGWPNLPDLVLGFHFDLLQGLDANGEGNDFRINWNCATPAIVKQHFSLEGPLHYELVDADPDDLPAGSTMDDFIDRHIEGDSNDVVWGMDPIPFGAVIHAHAIPFTHERPLGAQEGRVRRSGALVHKRLRNDGQLVTAANQQALPIASPPFRRTVHLGSDNSNAPDIDFAYGPVHDVTLDANSTPAFHLTQPLFPFVYDTLDYDYTGTVWTLIVRQDATGGRTFPWPAANTVFAGGGSGPVVSTGASAEDRFRIECIDPDETTPVFLVSVIAQNIS